MMSSMRAGGRYCYILSRDKNKKDQKKYMKKTGRPVPETGQSQATNLERQKQTKWIEMHQSQVIPKRSAEMLTEQKNPKFLRSLRNMQRDTINLAIR